MGKGGHHFSSGHYHRHGGRSDGEVPIGVSIVILIVCIAIIFLNETAAKNDIRNGEKISDKYLLTEYLYDEADYFDDSEEYLVIEGLKYFYQTTGAQMVIVTQDGQTTDKLTELKYYEMFDDEAHVLIVLPIKSRSGGNIVQYYYIGDEALKVINETGIYRMLEKIGNNWSSREKSWKEEIIDIANLIVS